MTRRLLGLTLALTTLGLIAAACSSGDGEESSAPAENGPSEEGMVDSGEGTVDMVADDFFFGPDQLSLEAGQTVTVNLENEGAAAHTFTIDDLGVDQVLNPGEGATITFTPSQSGTIKFYCRFHQAQGMAGSLAVSDGAGSANPSGGSPTAGGAIPVSGY